MACMLWKRLESRNLSYDGDNDNDDDDELYLASRYHMT